MKQAANVLRKSIQEADITPLPEDLVVEDIEKGEIGVPEEVKEFYKYLIGGERSKKWETQSTQNQINSLSTDTVSAVNTS